MDEIDVILNGAAERSPAGLTLSGLLERLERDPRTVAIELNGEIIPRGSFGEQLLAPGDRLEIVQFVQGG